MSKSNNLIWLDMEMSGLYPETDRIIEIAMIITDQNLNILAQSPVVAIHQADEVMDNMDAWNTSTHGKTGLTERVKQSNISEAEAEATMLQFVKEWTSAKSSPMCGNSVHQDRRFMVKYMPQLEEHFHYRNLDVSTLKELARRWHPALYKGFSKKGTHQALDDILESIDEMKYYRDHFLILPPNTDENQDEQQELHHP